MIMRLYNALALTLAPIAEAVRLESGADLYKQAFAQTTENPGQIYSTIAIDDD